MIRILFIVIIILLIDFRISDAKLSEGGYPRMPVLTKSALSEIVEMQRVNNDLLRWESETYQSQKPLKPLRFATAFDVSISINSHGKWFKSDDGWWIWQVHVRSNDAYSINLIFSNYNLNPGQKLFIFTPDYSYIIGAFTEKNIIEGNILATAPLPGDEVVVQFETPRISAEVPFLITQVNHDFIGILKFFDTRRPLGKTAGECIPDINCAVAEAWRRVQNSVCRVMVEGKELCTGILLNNTAHNSRPYILTANHCINTRIKATSSLFLFNYESPYCGSIDGDVSNSISGSILRATHDSLDFSLVELNVKPPPSFRPYYAGWNRATNPTDTVACIQHSQGDIKKISIDNDSPVVSSFGMDGYTRNGFWKINRWEYGATEVGASGGPLFNSREQVVGNLVGGTSRCNFPFNDYFSRFDMAWDNKPDSSKQLKYWLDPVKTNQANLDGKRFYEGTNFCKAFTNLVDGDEHELLRLTSTAGANAGYWTGTNNQGITEIGDKFTIPGNEKILGVSIGLGRRFLLSGSSSSKLRINIYNLRGLITEIIHTQQVQLRDLASGAMNYIPFNELIEPADSFLVAISFDNMASGDSIAIFQSVRKNNPKNSFYFRKNNQWSDFKRSNSAGYSGALAFEVVACNVSNTTIDTSKVDNPLEVKLFPNPTTGRLQISSNHNLTVDMISVYNLRGQKVPYRSARLTPRKIEINLVGHSNGIYLIRVLDGNKHFTGKIFFGAN